MTNQTASQTHIRSNQQSQYVQAEARNIADRFAALDDMFAPFDNGGYVEPLPQRKTRDQKVSFYEPETGITHHETITVWDDTGEEVDFRSNS